MSARGGRRLSRRPGLFLAVIAALFAGCDETPSDSPYVAFTGGGFVFNYRMATAEYGFIVKMLRQPPTGAVLEVRFEDRPAAPHWWCARCTDGVRTATRSIRRW